MSAQSQKKKEDEIVQRTSPPGQVVYHAIHDEGEHELKRSTMSLAWSGLAAGLSMGFSLVVEAILRVHLPAGKTPELISKFGYTIGFLIVILGRQQLFTENTLTAILPLLKKPSSTVLLNVGRLWAAVLLANLVGGFAFSALLAHTTLFEQPVREACTLIGREAVDHGFVTLLWRGVFAGWLIALMVWLLPFAETARVTVIIIISYVVGIGQFSHVIAGGIKSFYLVTTSELSLGQCLVNYLLPTLIGNIIGGVSLVAALGHAQFGGSKHPSAKP